MHQKTIRVQLREGPHFMLFINVVVICKINKAGQGYFDINILVGGGGAGIWIVAYLYIVGIMRHCL